MGNHPGQHIPSNQPCIHPDLSLGALTLYLLITSTLTTTPLSIIGTGGHMPSCIGSMVLTISWGSMSVSRGEQGESSLRVMVIATSTHSLAQSSVSYENSLMICSARGSSNHPNCQQVHQFSLPRRRMTPCDSVLTSKTSKGSLRRIGT